MLLFSKNTGSGKSSHNAFFSSIAGNHATLKVDTIPELLKEKNSEFLNRLLIYADDQERISKANSEKLKSKTTEKYYTYRRLYEDGVKMKALHDYILTTNKKNCLHINVNDRRVELISVNEIMSNSASTKTFWDTFYRERDDPNISKAFLNYFINFRSELDVRSKFCRFSVSDLEEEKINSIKISHRWFV